MAKDFYATLGVTKTATDEEIKKAYRKLARENHPDLHPNDKKAEARFKEVQEAYEVLGDKEKREKYDRFGSAAFEQGFPGGGAGEGRTYTWGPGQQGGSFEFGGMEDILQNIFGGRAKRGGGGFGGGSFASARGQDIETELAVPFRTALLGGSLDVHLSGRESEKLSVTIPAGVTDGSRLRLAGKGEPGSPGAPAGDLIVQVRVEPDRYFTREGNDVQIEVPVTVGEAVLGATIDVPTLEGTISLTIPPGTSSGQRLRLRSKGGKSRTGERGDQYIRIKILLPPNLDEESRRLIGEFEKRNPFSPRSFS